MWGPEPNVKTFELPTPIGGLVCDYVLDDLLCWIENAIREYDVALMRSLLQRSYDIHKSIHLIHFLSLAIKLHKTHIVHYLFDAYARVYVELFATNDGTAYGLLCDCVNSNQLELACYLTQEPFAPNTVLSSDIFPFTKYFMTKDPTVVQFMQIMTTITNAQSDHNIAQCVFRCIMPTQRIDIMCAWATHMCRIVRCWTVYNWVSSCDCQLTLPQKELWFQCESVWAARETDHREIFDLLTEQDVSLIQTRPRRNGYLLLACYQNWDLLFHVLQRHNPQSLGTRKEYIRILTLACGDGCASMRKLWTYRPLNLKLYDKVRARWLRIATRKKDVVLMTWIVTNTKGDGPNIPQLQHLFSQRQPSKLQLDYCVNQNVQLGSIPSSSASQLTTYLHYTCRKGWMDAVLGRLEREPLPGLSQKQQLRVLLTACRTQDTLMIDAMVKLCEPSTLILAFVGCCFELNLNIACYLFQFCKIRIANVRASHPDFLSQVYSHTLDVCVLTMLTTLRDNEHDYFGMTDVNAFDGQLMRIAQQFSRVDLQAWISNQGFYLLKKKKIVCIEAQWTHQSPQRLCVTDEM